MPTIRTDVEAAATRFVNEVLAILETCSLDELAAERAGEARRRRASGVSPVAARALKSPVNGAAKQKRARLARRSPEQIAKNVEQVVALLKRKKEGLRSEQIRDALQMQSKEMPRVLQEGLEAKRLRKTGQKRATIYFAK